MDGILDEILFVDLPSQTLSLQRSSHLTGGVNLDALELNSYDLVTYGLVKRELVLNVARELLVISSRICVGCAGDVGRETQTPAVGKVRGRAEPVGPKFGVHLVLCVKIPRPYVTRS